MSRLRIAAVSAAALLPMAAVAPLTRPLGPAVPAQPATHMAEGPQGGQLPVLAMNMYTMVVEDLKLGDGAPVERNSNITVHYHGTLTSGAVFDTTRGKDPATFPLSKLIPGWQAGLRGMKVGGVRRLTLPPILAYGDADRLDDDGKVKIPANSALVFSIELLKVDSGMPPITTPSGLKIEDLVVGTGTECMKGATVKVRYRGTLINGQEFDSGEIEYPLARLVQGWQEGVPGMKVGGKRKLYVPYKLGYGEQGFPPEIPPKADLIFEIELLEVK